MKKATRNFSTVLGEGQDGTVFRGQLNDGSVVAIRCVESSPKQNYHEFCKEMEFLGRLHHRHLVGLKGFCSTRFERLISVVTKFRYPPIMVVTVFCDPGFRYMNTWKMEAFKITCIVISHVLFSYSSDDASFVELYV